MHILIFDDKATPAIGKKQSFRKIAERYLPRARLSIVTSQGALSGDDKAACFRWLELADVCRDASAELWIMRLHREMPIQRIYCRQEDLMLRAARLRRATGLSHGPTVESVLAFRNKYLMKCLAKQGGLPVPEFAPVDGPTDLIGFVETHGFPIIVKPKFGSASAGVTAIEDWNKLHDYLAREFFASLDAEGKRLEYNGELMVEKFMNSPIVHVNGIWRDGSVERTWMFEYIGTVSIEI